jgi:hypothetical protein
MAIAASFNFSEGSTFFFLPNKRLAALDEPLAEDAVAAVPGAFTASPKLLGLSVATECAPRRRLKNIGKQKLHPTSSSCSTMEIARLIFSLRALSASFLCSSAVALSSVVDKLDEKCILQELNIYTTVRFSGQSHAAALKKREGKR